MILVMTILGSSNAFIGMNECSDDFKIWIESISPKTLNDEKIINSRGSNRFLQNDAIAGSWVDSFEDSSKIDWTMASNVILLDKDIIIHVTPSVDVNTRALWLFDESSGTTTYDETTNNNDGTLGGDGLGTDLPTWTSGISGNALNYDGIDDYVEVNDDPSLRLSSSYSVELYTKIDDLSSNRDLIVKGNVFGNPPRNYGLFAVSDGKAHFSSTRPGPAWNTACTSPTGEIITNKWFHIAGTWDGSSTATVFVNGVKKGTRTWTSVQTSSDVLRMGGWDGVFSKLDGKIDEVRISNITRKPVRCQANLTSNPINLPSTMLWDTLIINKTQPSNTFLNITIFNATNNQQIPGSPKYLDDGEFDISYIDSNKYPSIKLNASFTGNTWGLTPTFHYWGVSWNSSNSWQDSFFGGQKVSISNLVTPKDGNANFQNTGSLTSTTINISDEHYFDTMFINKTEPVGGSLKVSILDGSTNTPIPGFIDITDSQIDLSGFDIIAHPTIKLRATYTSGGALGTLHDWSINWTQNIAPVLRDITNPSQVKRTESALIAINLSDLEDLEDDLTLDVKYKSPSDTNWQIDYLSDPSYNDNRWEYLFTPPVDAKIGAYQFSISCTDSFQYVDNLLEPNFITVLNNQPEIVDITPSSLVVNRTKTLIFTINALDVEADEEYLDLDITYKSPNDLSWRSGFVDNIIFSSDHWECTFTPAKNADVGTYTINVTCNDTDSEVYNEFTIEVINNKPTQPIVEVLPLDPRTTDTLSVVVSGTTDIESRLNDIEFWYRWYTDDVYLPFFDNATTVPFTQTLKGEVWKCEVFPFDGDDTGTPGEVEVIIQNSMPELVELFNNVNIYEDKSIILKDKLTTIFSDADYDPLTFSATGQVNLTVEIFPENGTIILTPDENWFGTEFITFHAYDQSIFPAEAIVEITVQPTNDLPRLVQIGSQVITSGHPLLEYLVKQDEWLNLTIVVEDVDGDVERGLVNYVLNITERSNLYFSKLEPSLIFLPANDDVGVHFMNIAITDNNETPTVYISQDIKIRVLNSNDPPTVNINQPADKQTFKETEDITLSCTPTDIDLSVPDTQESFTYLWYTDKTEVGTLGSNQDVTIPKGTLPPGEYNITVEIRDAAGETAYDHVFIEIEEVEIDETRTDFFFYLVLLIIIIIIIAILISLFFMMRKKKKAKEKYVPPGYGEPILQPDASFQPEVIGGAVATSGSRGVPLGHVAQISQPQVIQRESVPSAPTQELLAPMPTATTPTPEQPTAQLPPARLPTPEPTPIPEPTPTPQPVPTTTPTLPSESPGPKVEDSPPGQDSELPVKEKIALLEERLIRGEIDQEVYKDLRAKFENEAKSDESAP
jgi:hypothetical protein